jgi:hypothetical protein
MPDWKTRARAMAPDIPEESIERLTRSLDSLEASFRPQLERLPFEMEPSFTMRVPGPESAE